MYCKNLNKCCKFYNCQNKQHKIIFHIKMQNLKTGVYGMIVTLQHKVREMLWKCDCRAMFYYRGDTLFNVRYGHYKAHFYTWATPQEAIDIVSLRCSIHFFENDVCFLKKNIYFLCVSQQFCGRNGEFCVTVCYQDCWFTGLLG